VGAPVRVVAELVVDELVNVVGATVSLELVNVAVTLVKVPVDAVDESVAVGLDAVAVEDVEDTDVSVSVALMEVSVAPSVVDSASGSVDMLADFSASVSEVGTSGTMLHCSQVCAQSERNADPSGSGRLHTFESFASASWHPLEPEASSQTSVPAEVPPVVVATMVVVDTVDVEAVVDVVPEEVTLVSEANTVELSSSVPPSASCLQVLQRTGHSVCIRFAASGNRAMSHTAKGNEHVFSSSSFPSQLLVSVLLLAAIIVVMADLVVVGASGHPQRAAHNIAIVLIEQADCGNSTHVLWSATPLQVAAICTDSVAGAN
jgi:hypothetical protein